MYSKYIERKISSEKNFESRPYAFVDLSLMPYLLSLTRRKHIELLTDDLFDNEHTRNSVTRTSAILPSTVIKSNEFHLSRK